MAQLALPADFTALDHLAQLALEEHRGDVLADLSVDLADPHTRGKHCGHNSPASIPRGSSPPVRKPLVLGEHPKTPVHPHPGGNTSPTCLRIHRPRSSHIPVEHLAYVFAHFTDRRFNFPHPRGTPRLRGAFHRPPVHPHTRGEHIPGIRPCCYHRAVHPHTVGNTGVDIKYLPAGVHAPHPEERLPAGGADCSNGSSHTRGEHLTEPMPGACPPGSSPHPWGTTVWLLARGIKTLGSPHTVGTHVV